MSFSVEVKQEIAESLPKKECCLITLGNCFDIAALTDCIMGKCCIKTVLKQAFLEFGTMNQPENSYHLEFVLHGEELASLICAFLNDYALGAKILLRNGAYIVYIKNAEAIADFLKLVGAANALMYFENVRIVKEVRGNINREINCEAANIQKKIDAAFRQTESIQWIQDTVGLDALSDELRVVAKLRLAHMDLGFAELGEKLTPQLGKSGVRHRMAKIMQIAENLKSKGEM